jgi:hypothetical protein
MYEEDEFMNVENAGWLMMERGSSHPDENIHIERGSSHPDQEKEEEDAAKDDALDDSDSIRR